jgi:hypothetical protein
MAYLKAFIAGFIATLTFHQGVLALLHLLSPGVPAPFNLEARAPLGVPAVVSLAFWGGVWGVALWPLLRKRVGAAYWTFAIVAGAIGPSVVAWFVVMPLKGMGPAGNWDPKIIIGALLLNAAWGLGYGLFMRLMQRS